MKPIIFNTEMVKAILEGRKSVTRRVVKPQPVFPTKIDGQTFTIKKGDLLVNKGNIEKFDIAVGNKWLTSKFKLPYQVGDILYVRETWSEWCDGYCYRAGGCYYPVSYTKSWQPSIHMPKEAARIFLKVTDVRVERLQNMTEDDAIKEGIKDDDYDNTPLMKFWKLWNKLVKREDVGITNFEANPWVWVIEFERCEKGV